MVTKSTVTRTITDEVFTASDGTQFSDERSAEYHEWTLTATSVWTITVRGGRNEQLTLLTG